MAGRCIIEAPKTAERSNQDIELNQSCTSTSSARPSLFPQRLPLLHSPSPSSFFLPPFSSPSPPSSTILPHPLTSPVHPHFPPSKLFTHLLRQQATSYTSALPSQTCTIDHPRPLAPRGSEPRLFWSVRVWANKGRERDEALGRVDGVRG